MWTANPALGQGFQPPADAPCLRFKPLRHVSRAFAIATAVKTLEEHFEVGSVQEQERQRRFLPRIEEHR